MDQTIADRFWSRVDKESSPHGCWAWTGHRDERGYGTFWIKRVMHRSHRVAYTLLVGPIPVGLCCCHKCDNTSCVNPSHIFLGTQADNNRDRDRKGRQVSHRGESHYLTKFTDNDVVHIRKSVADGRSTITKLAKQYGVSPTCICNITKRRCWNHLP